MMQKKIPISAARDLARKYDFDQIIVLGRRIGEIECLTTYGRDKTNCEVAKRIGDFLSYKVMGWEREK